MGPMAKFLTLAAILTPVPGHYRGEIFFTKLGQYKDIFGKVWYCDANKNIHFKLELYYFVTGNSI
jgi:hypothetical protein